MKEVFVSTEELAKICGIIPSTLRVYLGNYRFSKFVTKTKLGDRYKVAVKLNKKCGYALCEFFMMHGREDVVANLEKYFEDRDNGNKWFWYL